MTDTILHYGAVILFVVIIIPIMLIGIFGTVKEHIDFGELVTGKIAVVLFGIVMLYGLFDLSIKVFTSKPGDHTGSGYSSENYSADHYRYRR